MSERPRMTRYEVISLATAAFALGLSLLVLLLPVLREYYAFRPLISIEPLDPNMSYAYSYDKGALELTIVVRNCSRRRQTLVNLETWLEMPHRESTTWYPGKVDCDILVLEEAEAKNVGVSYTLAGLPVHPTWRGINSVERVTEAGGLRPTRGLAGAEAALREHTTGARAEAKSSEEALHNELELDSDHVADSVPANELDYSARLHVFYRAGPGEQKTQVVFPIKFWKTSKAFMEAFKQAVGEDEH